MTTHRVDHNASCIAAARHTASADHASAACAANRNALDAFAKMLREAAPALRASLAEVDGLLRGAAPAIRKAHADARAVQALVTRGA